MTPTAVIQVKSGIGDVVWHLPFIRAIAGASPAGQVSFLAPPSSHAGELLVAEPAVAETIYFDHGGSELRRGLNLVRLVALLRRKRFRSIWILDRTVRPALAARLAGIPERIGLGLGRQSVFITNAGIDQRHFHDHPLDWLRALMTASRIALPTTEPALMVPDTVLGAIGARFAARPRPWCVVGIGASDPIRDWPETSWTHFLAALRNSTVGTVFIIGGSANAARAQRLIDAGIGTAAPIINGCGLSLGEAVALLRHADLFVGTDSGPMNLAAAVGTPAYGLFGVNPVLTYSQFIHPITPEGGQSRDGMSRIAPARVMEHIAPRL